MNLDIINHTRPRDRKTGIIATVGPASWDKDSLRTVVLAGMNVMRLNFSHGTYDQKRMAIENLREITKEFRDPAYHVDFSDGALESICAIAADTKGPEIRTGLFADGQDVQLEPGGTLSLSINEADRPNGTKALIWIDYPTLTHEVMPGQSIYIDDGLISLTVLEIDKGAGLVHCRVNNGGALGAQKGTNIPGLELSLPALSTQDKRDLEFCKEMDVDMVFASFIRKAQDVIDIRQAIGDSGKHIKIISKIENVEGVQKFDEILAESDGIMVARGDLGIEIPTEKVFLAQKSMIAKCNVAGKPVICATQMLESMVHNPRPTRAECSDVANAVLDGADCVMLSGETAKGKYPVESITMMSEICREAESAINYRTASRELRSIARLQAGVDGGSKAFLTGQTGIVTSEKQNEDMLRAIATSAVIAAFELDAAVIIVLSRTGKTCQAVSKFRPHCPILMVTDCERTARMSSLLKGVHPFVEESAVMQNPNPEEVMHHAVKWAVTMGMCEKGDSVVVVRGPCKPSGRMEPNMDLLYVD